MIFATGATSQSHTVMYVDDSGIAVTGLVAATMPATYYSLPGLARVQITLSDLAAVNSAWSSGGVKEIGDGVYRLDAPNLMHATAGAAIISVAKTADKNLLMMYEIQNDASLAKIQAAVYDSAPANGNVITLSNGATQTVSASGRVTA